MIKFRVSRYGKIEPVTIVKETEHFVTIERINFTGSKSCNREAKTSDSYKIVDSEELAKDWLESFYADRIKMR